MIEFKEPGDPGKFGVAAAGGSLPPNHRWAWKTIPQAEYDDLCGQAAEFIRLRVEVCRALERLTGPEFRLDWVQDAASILRDAVTMKGE